ncbi:MAG: hypothetical protein ABI681_07705 [Gemmatimonadales bacterium]
MRIVPKGRAAATGLWLAAFALAAAPGTLAGQEQSAAAPKKKVLTAEEKAAADMAKGIALAKAQETFYATSTPLEFTLQTNIKRIRGDKGDKAPWRPAVMSYVDPEGKKVAVPSQIRTRGIWRKKNCEFPPIRLNFKSETTKGTLLQGFDKPKLINYCHDTDDYEQYIIQEMQLYRIYNLLTPASHRARLLRMTYEDSATGKLHARRAAILLEEPEVMAARLGGPIIELKGAIAEDLEPFHQALAALFQYFIGNTDFSTYALHNMELVNQASGEIIPVPFDFDFSGVINARYATADPKLTIQRVRDRLFRGYCQNPDDLAKAFSRFNEKKDAIYALYQDSIGKLLRPKIVEETLRYYDEFYKTINDPRRAKREIIEECIKTN